MMHTRKLERYSLSIMTHLGEDALFALKITFKRIKKMMIHIWDSQIDLTSAELTNASTDIISNAYIVTGLWQEKSKKMSSDATSCIKCPRRKDVQLAEERSRLQTWHIFKTNTRSILKSTIKRIEYPKSWLQSWEDTGVLKSSELEDSLCHSWKKSLNEWKLTYSISK